MKRIGILGASGYTALELMELLQNHPECRITCLTSRDATQPALNAVHPRIQSLELNFEVFELESFCDKVDFAFSCLPHAASAESVAQLSKAGIPVIDFSADYRLDSQSLFESVYEVPHPDSGRLGDVPYGLPELFREQIAGASLVANPGCFPTSILLPLAPLLAQQLVTGPVIADSKTGISGAGRKTNLKFHFPECNESTSAYGIGTHRHRPEVQNVLQRYSARSLSITFTPHLIPMERGILTTLYLNQADASQVRECLTQTYSHEPFIKLTSQPPSTRDVSRTNRCHIHVGQDEHCVVVVSAIDNLQKGASGAAVQNFNLMCGFQETLGLTF